MQTFEAIRANYQQPRLHGEQQHQCVRAVEVDSLGQHTTPAAGAKNVTESASIGGRVSFAMVYVAEAHACDEWPIQSSRHNGNRGAVCIKQHKTTAERCAAAAAFVRDFSVSMPVLVDPVPEQQAGQSSSATGPVDGGDNGDSGSGSGVVGYGTSGPFDAALAPWPLRFYVLDRGGVLRYKADPHDCQYDLFALQAWLDEQLALTF